MKRIFLFSGSLMVFLLLLTGCRSGAVYNVMEHPVEGKFAQNDDVYKAIKKAGMSLGWNIKKVSEGEAIGKLALRSHLAVVSIKYDTKSYSIEYKDSTNLNYDATKGTIHSNYNGWVQNLRNAIDAQLF